NFPTSSNIVATDVKIGKVHQIRLKYKDGEIKIREFTLPNQIHNGDKIDNSIEWAITMKATNDNESSIRIRCGFKDQIIGFSDTGEHLDALQFIKNEKYQLHIGTEAPESIMWRAKEENAMPSRFFTMLKNAKRDYAEKAFTHYESNGFVTKYPNLKKDELIQFHYLIAASELQNENDVRTWLAVERRIEEIEKIIKSATLP
uniref:hypothetical protein n=1 Tax=Lewinella sp. TaxID=2004506 RepID=UPI003D6A4A65